MKLRRTDRIFLIGCTRKNWTDFLSFMGVAASRRAFRGSASSRSIAAASMLQQRFAPLQSLTQLTRKKDSYILSGQTSAEKCLYGTEHIFHIFEAGTFIRRVHCPLSKPDVHTWNRNLRLAYVAQS